MRAPLILLRNYCLLLKRQLAAFGLNLRLHVLDSGQTSEFTCFPAALESVEKTQLQRLHEFHDRLRHAPQTRKTLAKLELVQEAIGRLSVACGPQGV